MPKQKIKAVIVTAFEPDAGPIPGEFRYFREREGLVQELPFPAGYRPLWMSAAGVVGIVTGAGRHTGGGFDHGAWTRSAL